MRRGVATRAVACVGAVVGAGFASGREIITFFTQYQRYSWLLILLSATAMCALYTLLSMRPPRSQKLRPGMQRACKGFRVLLLAVTGGAMVSACGEVAALMLPVRAAYAVGVVGCVLAAFWLSGKSLQPLAGISWVLLALLGVSFVLLLAFAKEGAEPLPAEPTLTVAAGMRAAGFAVGYACLNIALSMGVICGETGETCGRPVLRSGVYFGWMMTLLMLLSNYLYLRHPSALQATLPIVQLLSRFGLAGFWTSASLLLFALMTSLIGVLRGLRRELEPLVSPRWRRVIIPALPVLVSLVGFSRIVGVLYPYLGLLCILLIYAPLLRRSDKRAASPDSIP